MTSDDEQVLPPYDARRETGDVASDQPTDEGVGPAHTAGVPKGEDRASDG